MANGETLLFTSCLSLILYSSNQLKGIFCFIQNKPRYEFALFRRATTQISMKNGYLVMRNKISCTMVSKIIKSLD